MSRHALGLGLYDATSYSFTYEATHRTSADLQ